MASERDCTTCGGVQRITLVLLDADMELLHAELADMNGWLEQRERETGVKYRRWLNVEEVAAVVLGLELQQRARARACAAVVAEVQP